MRFATDGLATRVVCPKAVSPKDELYTLSEHTKPSARRDKSRVCIAGGRPAHAHVLYNSSGRRERRWRKYTERKSAPAIAGHRSSGARRAIFCCHGDCCATVARLVAHGRGAAIVETCYAELLTPDSVRVLRTRRWSP